MIMIWGPFFVFALLICLVAIDSGLPVLGSVAAGLLVLGLLFYILSECAVTRNKNHQAKVGKILNNARAVIKADGPKKVVMPGLDGKTPVAKPQSKKSRRGQKIKGGTKIKGKAADDLIARLKAQGQL